MHSFYLANIPPAGTAASLERRDAEHLFRTLRAREGDALRLFDGKGKLAFGTVGAGQDILVEAVADAPPPACRVEVCTAVPRRNLADQMLSQLAEVGAWSITPVEFRRSVAMPENTPERWQLRLIEGCKQSGNPFLPELRPPASFSEVLSGVAASGVPCFYGNPQAVSGIPLRRPERLVWMVGPEGGFAPEELAALEEAGATGIRLGDYIMRLETACVVGTALLNSAPEERS